MQMIGEKAADQRADHAREHEGRCRLGLIARPLPRRHEVGDDGLGDRKNAATAYALKCARRDQRPHRRRERTGNRADDEDGETGQQDGAPAVDVRELAKQRCHRRCAQEI